MYKNKRALIALKLYQTLTPRFQSLAFYIQHPVTRCPIRFNRKFHLDHLCHLFESSYNEICLLHKLLTPGSVVWEVDATIGYFTQIFAEIVGPTGKVCAFEPSRRNLKHLPRNTRSFRGISIHAAAISDVVGTVHIQVNQDFSYDLCADSSYDSSPCPNIDLNARGYQNEQASSLTLDAFRLTQKKSPNLIKINSKHVGRIISGATNVLAKDRPALLVNINSNDSSLVRILSAYAYSLSMVQDTQQLDEPLNRFSSQLYLAEPK